MRALLLSACLLLPAATLHGQAASVHKAHSLTWGPAPAVFPKGAKMAVVSGDSAGWRAGCSWGSRSRR